MFFFLISIIRIIERLKHWRKGIFCTMCSNIWSWQTDNGDALGFRMRKLFLVPFASSDNLACAMPTFPPGRLCTVYRGTATCTCSCKYEPTESCTQHKKSSYTISLKQGRNRCSLMGICPLNFFIFFLQ